MPPLSVTEELALLLRPAGGGVHAVSTGLAEQRAVQARCYGTSDPGEIQRAFRARLERVAQAKVVILGVPSDVGAGVRRGSNLAPQAIRAAMLEDARVRPWFAAGEVIDIGDVWDPS